MSDAFFDTSKTIANDFLQSVVFIDDRAFIDEKETNEHEFNAVQITRAFANSQKVCAVYRPETLEDIDNLSLLAKKADVTVLDWRIDIAEEDAEDENGEEDAEEIDPRGPHTLKIIREILSDPLTGKGSLKLILIYTGETHLPAITDTIYDNLQEQHIENVHKGDCTVFTENIRILVLAKQAGEGQFKHNPKLKNKIVSYEALPDFILTQFTDMTSGLLTNFTLKCLTAIRNGSFQLIGLFGKKLDAAYLAHRSLLPNNRDAEDQLIELMKDSIGDLLHYHGIAEFLNEDTLKIWIGEHMKPKKIAFKDQKGNPFKDSDGKVINASYPIDCQLGEKLLISNETEVVKRFKEAFKDRNIDDLKTRGNKDAFLSQIQRDCTSLFSEENADFQELDRRLAKLSHHRNLFKPVSYLPKLWQGTIIKGVESQKYWICIQQKCDSVRLKPEVQRRFLFLPLVVVAEESGDKFHFITPDDVKLRLITKSYELRTMKFSVSDDSGMVIAKEDVGRYLFYPLYSNSESSANKEEAFEWVFDLKDLHSQRVVNDYAREISRVGLDESEWLRRWAT